MGQRVQAFVAPPELDKSLLFTETTSVRHVGICQGSGLVAPDGQFRHELDAMFQTLQLKRDTEFPKLCYNQALQSCEKLDQPDIEVGHDLANKNGPQKAGPLDVEITHTRFTQIKIGPFEENFRAYFRVEGLTGRYRRGSAQLSTLSGDTLSLS